MEGVSGACYVAAVSLILWGQDSTQRTHQPPSGMASLGMLNVVWRPEHVFSWFEIFKIRRQDTVCGHRQLYFSVALSLSALVRAGSGLSLRVP